MMLFSRWRRFTFSSLGIAVAGLLVAGSAWAAEPKTIFEDRFEGRLADGWSWLREDASAWRFKDGSLEIRVQPGVATTVKNALVRIAPDRSKARYAVDVTIAFTQQPTNQYEQAGITWYREKKPVLKLVHQLIDGKTYIIPGKIPTASRTMQLRLIVDRERFTAQFRPDGQSDFQTAAQGALPLGHDEQVSIQCYNGPPDKEHWIRFDDFRIVQLTD